MSLHIRTLEDKLGARLLHRSPHSVALTAEGRRLLPEIQALVDMHDRMVGRLQSGPVYGEVRLGVAEAYAASLFPGLLKLCVGAASPCGTGRPVPAERAP